MRLPAQIGAKYVHKRSTRVVSDQHLSNCRRARPPDLGGARGQGDRRGPPGRFRHIRAGDRMRSRRRPPSSHATGFVALSIAAPIPAQWWRGTIRIRWCGSTSWGTANVLEVARVHKTTRFVYCSSTSAYGPTPPEPVPEDVTMRPSTVYGASKVASEQLVRTYASQYCLNGTSLRLSWVYGPRRTTDCVIRTMIRPVGPYVWSLAEIFRASTSMWRMRLARWS
jgi:hypothetical protein